MNVGSPRRLAIPPGYILVEGSYLDELEKIAKSSPSNSVHQILASLAQGRVPSRLAFFQYGATFTYGSSTTLFPTHNAGLFSCLCTIMWTIRSILEVGSQLPDSINNVLSMYYFKSNGSSNNYPLLFQQPSASSLAGLQLAALSGPSVFDHHGEYKGLFDLLGLEWICKYAEAYLRPSLPVLARIDYFINKYSITDARTVSVCIRGTDKQSEVVPDPISTYINTVRDLLRAGSVDQVLVQTDQAQILDLFRTEFKHKCIFIEELPTTYGQTVMHRDDKFLLNRDSWSQDLVAMVLAISRAKYLVTHTGNVGLFLSLFHCMNGGVSVQYK